MESCQRLVADPLTFGSLADARARFANKSRRTRFPSRQIRCRRGLHFFDIPNRCCNASLDRHLDSEDTILALAGSRRMATCLCTTQALRHNAEQAQSYNTVQNASYIFQILLARILGIGVPTVVYLCTRHTIPVYRSNADRCHSVESNAQNSKPRSSFHYAA